MSQLNDSILGLVKKFPLQVTLLPGRKYSCKSIQCSKLAATNLFRDKMNPLLA